MSLLSTLSSDELTELFPMLEVCNCISDAEESGNGPRYCAKDRLTKCMYEVRCFTLPSVLGQSDDASYVSQLVTLPGEAQAGVSVETLRAQQERLNSLTAASQRDDLPPSIVFPVDAYVQHLESRGKLYVVSVSAFSGLSLGDIIRSGWRLIDETDFEDILSCVEVYGAMCMELPPHRNLTFNALLRQLNVRPGAVEACHQSRWAIGDWFLLPGDESRCSQYSLLADLEWLLHCVFSKLNVLCGGNGAVMPKDVLEMRIGRTIDNIRAGMSRYVLRKPLSSFSGSFFDTVSEEGISSSATDAVDKARPYASIESLMEQVSIHQQKLRQEQQIILSYRKQIKGCKNVFKCENTYGASGADRVAGFGCWRGELDSTDSATSTSHDCTKQVAFMSRALCQIQLRTDRDRQESILGERDAVLSNIIEVVDMSIDRDNERRQSEEQARRMHRDTLHSILLRYAIGRERQKKTGQQEKSWQPRQRSAVSYGTSGAAGSAPIIDFSLFNVPPPLQSSSSPLNVNRDMQASTSFYPSGSNTHTDGLLSPRNETNPQPPESSVHRNVSPRKPKVPTLGSLGTTFPSMGGGGGMGAKGGGFGALSARSQTRRADLRDHSPAHMLKVSATARSLFVGKRISSGGHKGPSRRRTNIPTSPRTNKPLSGLDNQSRPLSSRKNEDPSFRQPPMWRTRSNAVPPRG
uniref:Uncharacterized protein n=1 Tax=Trypanosoma vivax (strain Y486) TaxID=1055687 RepID=G0TX39_TRYVY|nr:conserved hypothetical protein [Trypanosoma vivax Y486]